MADGDNPLSHHTQQLADLARRLALPAACTDCDDRNYGNAALQHGLVGTKDSKVCSRRHDKRRFRHHIVERHIRVGENDIVDMELFDKARQLRFRKDWYTVWIQSSGKFSWVFSPFDIRNLSRS